MLSHDPIEWILANSTRKKDEGKAARMKKDGITSSKVMLLTVLLVGAPG